MNFGGPVWHASAGGKASKAKRRQLAIAALEGVGSKELGEWHDATKIAYHVRRRLSKEEELVVGPVVDIRGTEEALRRAARSIAVRPMKVIIKLVEDELKISWSKE